MCRTSNLQHASRGRGLAYIPVGSLSVYGTTIRCCGVVDTIYQVVISTCGSIVVVVVVVFTLKTVLTSIQYPSLSYSSRQRNEFPWSHANPK